MTVYVASVSEEGWAYGTSAANGITGWFALGVLDDGSGNSLRVEDVRHLFLGL